MWVKTWGYQWSGMGTGANLVDIAGNDRDHVISIPDPSSNQWHHLVVTYNRPNGVAQVYLDGKLAKEATLGSFTPQTSYDLYIGKRPTQNDAQFYGLIDEVAIYNRVLTAQEVLTHYHEGTE
jgi:hypothetical protein